MCIVKGPPRENVKRIKDEIFHIPAAERYCQSNYSYWDPKITTPPGLYIYSSLIAKAVGLFVNVECDTITLRVRVKNRHFYIFLRRIKLYNFNQLVKSNKYPTLATSLRLAQCNTTISIWRIFWWIIVEVIRGHHAFDLSNVCFLFIILLHR